MNILDRKTDDIVILSVSGNIDALTSPALLEHIRKQISQEIVKIVADLKGVDYTSSAGLRVLLTAVKETRALNGDLRLANIQPNVQKVLSLSGFINILKSYPDAESAIISFSE